MNNDRIIAVGSETDSKAPIVQMWQEPTEEQKKRTYHWSKLVAEGKKGQYNGLPLPVVTKKTKKLEEDEQVIDTSEKVGAIKKIAARRAKNKVAAKSRAVNR